MFDRQTDNSYEILNRYTSIRKRKLKFQSGVRQEKSSSRFTPHPSLGFTLAEVLITLGIIGVVAAMTIPTLINNAQEQTYKTAYKTAYSTASQAWATALNDGKIEENVTGGDMAARIDNFAAFKSYFKVAKDCNNGNNADCWADGEKYWGGPLTNASAFIDATGRAWAIHSNDNSGAGATLFIDTNGSKKPNKYGQDRFVMSPGDDHWHITGIATRIYPVGDCLSTSDCSAGNYANVCPSVATHPCYYTSWLIGN